MIGKRVFRRRRTEQHASGPSAAVAFTQIWRGEALSKSQAPEIARALKLGHKIMALKSLAKSAFLNAPLGFVRPKGHRDHTGDNQIRFDVAHCLCSPLLVYQSNAGLEKQVYAETGYIVQKVFTAAML